MPRGITLLGGQALCSRAAQIWYSGNREALQLDPQSPKTTDFDFIAASEEDAEDFLQTLDKQAHSLQIQTKDEPTTHHPTVTVKHKKLVSLTTSSQKTTDEPPCRKTLLSVDIFIPKETLPRPPAKPDRPDLAQVRREAEKTYTQLCESLSTPTTAESQTQACDKAAQRAINRYLSDKRTLRMQTIHQHWLDYWQSHSARLTTQATAAPYQNGLELPCITLSDCLEIMALQLETASEAEKIHLEIQAEEDRLNNLTPRKTLDISNLPLANAALIGNRAKLLERLKWLSELHKASKQRKLAGIPDNLEKLAKQWLEPPEELFFDAQDTLDLSRVLTSRTAKGRLWQSALSAYTGACHFYSRWLTSPVHTLYVRACLLEQIPKSSGQTKRAEAAYKNAISLREDYSQHLLNHPDELEFLAAHSSTTLFENPNASPAASFRTLHDTIINICLIAPMLYELVTNHSGTVDKLCRLATDATSHKNPHQKRRHQARRQLEEVLKSQADALILAFSVCTLSAPFLPLGLWPDWMNTCLATIQKLETNKEAQELFKSLLADHLKHTRLGYIAIEADSTIDAPDILISRLMLIRHLKDYEALGLTIKNADENKAHLQPAPAQAEQVSEILTAINGDINQALQTQTLDQDMVQQAVVAYKMLHRSSMEGWLATFVDKPCFAELRAELAAADILLENIQPDLVIHPRPPHPFFYSLSRRTALASSHPNPTTLETESSPDSFIEDWNTLNKELEKQFNGKAELITASKADELEQRLSSLDTERPAKLQIEQIVYIMDLACAQCLALNSIQADNSASAHVCLESINNILSRVTLSFYRAIHSSQATHRDSGKTLKTMQNTLHKSPLFQRLCHTVFTHSSTTRFDVQLAQQAIIADLALKQLNPVTCSKAKPPTLNESLIQLDNLPYATSSTLAVQTIFQLVTTQIHTDIKTLSNPRSSLPEQLAARQSLNTILDSIRLAWLGKHWFELMCTYTRRPIPDSQHALKALGSHLKDFHVHNVRLTEQLERVKSQELLEEWPSIAASAKTFGDESRTGKKKPKKIAPKKINSVDKSEPAIPSEPPDVQPVAPGDALLTNASDTIKIDRKQGIALYEEIIQQYPAESPYHAKALLELAHLSVNRLEKEFSQMSTNQKKLEQFEQRLNQGLQSTPPSAPDMSERSSFINVLGEMRNQCQSVEPLIESCRQYLTQLKAIQPNHNDIIPDITLDMLNDKYQHYRSMTTPDLLTKLEEIKTVRTELMKRIGEHKKVMGLDVKHGKKLPDLTAIENTIALLGRFNNPTIAPSSPDQKTAWTHPQFNSEPGMPKNDCG
ncbi:hypothetical protein [Parendozoicomonas haliclonae]|uniref:Uncharacterized protein n=1 Tax=Parendozoicomonas haliclonae TaxID=1960125 RepID=A0A1X7APY7_9GAMM|nr:hypothetical protein [Parendozoicomonas haliclonae]SMA50356.1 hypothetical protein EHSB41UT_04153 [Parendozoicomonas haliclonae]